MVRWAWLRHGLLLYLLVVGMASTAAVAEHARPEAGRVTKPRHTLKALRDRHVVKQRFDYSCGSAALATLMNYYFGEAVSEQDLLKIILSRYGDDTKALKEKEGLSLLDLKYAAEARGYQAAGFKLTFEQLTRLSAPVIVFVEPRGYQHFAVLRGVQRGQVFLADPARGNLRMRASRFLQEWHGVVFALGKAGGAQIGTYPLALPELPEVQLGQVQVRRTSVLEALPTHLAVQSRLR